MRFMDAPEWKGYYLKNPNTTPTLCLDKTAAIQLLLLDNPVSLVESL